MRVWCLTELKQKLIKKQEESDDILQKIINFDI